MLLVVLVLFVRFVVENFFNYNPTWKNSLGVASLLLTLIIIKSYKSLVTVIVPVSMCKSRFRVYKYYVFASTDNVENLWKISQIFGKLSSRDFFHPCPHPGRKLLCGNV